MIGMLKNVAPGILLLCSVVLLSVRDAYAADPPSPFALSLSKAIELAYKNNKDIQIQEREVRIAKSNILGAVSQMLPQVNLGGAFTHNDAVLSFPGEAAESTNKDPGLFTGYKNNFNTALSANESVFNGGGNIANLKQSQVNLKVQEQTLRARKLDAEFDARRLYYGLLLAFETERIAGNILGQAQVHYHDVENKFSQGTSSRFDLLQSGVYVSLQTPPLVKSQKDIELIMAELNKLIGLKVYNKIQPQEKLSYFPITIKEDEFLGEAALNSPQMIVKSLGIDVEKWGIEIARSYRRPQVTADFDWYYQSDNLGDMFNPRHNNWYAGAAVTIPIFDGFSTKAKVDAAKSKYAQAVLKKEDITDQIAVDIRRACLDLRQAETVILSQRDSVVQAQDALSISIISYDNGVDTNLNVLDSMVALSQVEQNLASGIYDYQMAQAALDRTMGRSVK
ncbi:MAG: TolC family protein [Candidatus Aureabacteria bacterium]|nr:TolC family protein [Candidatus Auribacterota bacterium]